MSVTINASTSSGLVQTADTSGTVEIQSNGSTKLTIASTGAYGQLVSGTAQTASSTAVDFTGIPSWVKRITVMFSGLSANGTSPLLIQIGDSGGIENSGYTGCVGYIQAAASSQASAYSTGFAVSPATGMSADDTFSGFVSLVLLGSNQWAFGGSWGLTNAAVPMFGGGVKTLSDTLTQVRITTVNGTDTFDAGTINILYEG